MNIFYYSVYIILEKSLLWFYKIAKLIAKILAGRLALFTYWFMNVEYSDILL